ncbi:Lrp/AsnC family transcriptional regulator [Cellulomonas denverensis]|uniref:Lrp/AsnC family transcriptional regulator n=1 Tax=Cellulomonas denverensis TaxID=264297 RepID=A0A7X6KUW6_9CELL|nr:Lrp/AsnC family transcriptional regulator [Cellulomonas denverensis]NKY22709.1 Lrp/AsnC family transcriptional regulator [Cellulomonas denverensis]GIG24643.1 AsnC family transcriptional regulator [Cellulomonas denverensis]
MTDVTIDDLDLRLIDALQSRPRASWTSLASVLGSSAVTLARRWERLRETGAAWMTVAPDLSTGYGSLAMGMALVEVQVRTGTLHTTAAELALCPEIATLELTSGGRSLMLTVIAGDGDDLADFLLNTLESMPGVTQVRTHPAPRTVMDASGWRLHSADRARQPGVDGPHRPVPHHALASAVARELARDGRATAAEVAATLGLSTRTARAAIAGLVASGRIRFRTEIARPLSGWPVCSWYLIRSTPSRRDAVGRRLSQLREVRAVMQTVGTTDLAVVVWMRSLTDVQDLELQIEEMLPDVVIEDRALVFRTVKIMGRLLDADQMATGFVPLPAYLEPARGRTG